MFITLWSIGSYSTSRESKRVSWAALLTSLKENADLLHKKALSNLNLIYTVVDVSKRFINQSHSVVKENPQRYMYLGFASYNTAH